MEPNTLREGILEGVEKCFEEERLKCVVFTLVTALKAQEGPRQLKIHVSIVNERQKSFIQTILLLEGASYSRLKCQGVFRGFIS